MVELPIKHYNEKKKEPVFASIFDEDFIRSTTDIFKRNNKLWSGFRDSSLLMITEIEKLDKKMSIPIVAGESEIEYPIGEYLETLSETKKTLQDDEGVDEDKISLIMMSAAPFIGVNDKISLSELTKKYAPLDLVEKYKKELKTNALSSAIEMGADQMNKSAIWGIFWGSISYTLTRYFELITALERFPTLSSAVSLVPILVPVGYYSLSGIKKGVKEYQKCINKPTSQKIKERLLTFDGEVSPDLIEDPVARDTIIDHIEEAVYKDHKKGRVEIGSNIYKIIKKGEDKDILDKIWNIKNDRGMQWNEPLVAKRLTEESLKKLQKITEILTYQGLDSERYHSRREEYKKEYERELEKLLDLLDQSKYIHEKDDPFILKLMWDKLMEVRLTRRQFIIGGAALSSISILSIIASRIFPTSEPEIEKLYARPKIEGESKINTIDQKLLLRVFSESLDRYWPENGERNEALQLLSIDDYSSRIQGQAMLYFAAKADIKNKSSEEQQALYKQYLANEYIPYMVYFAKGLKLNLTTLITGTVLSSNNVGGITAQNQDVQISEVQRTIGGLGWYLHKNWGIPFNELTKTALYGLLNPYNAPRITGNITIGWNDLELGRVADGYFSLPSDDRKRFAKKFPNIWHPLFLLKRDRKDEEDTKYILRQQVVEYVLSSCTDESSPIFKILRENSGWDEIGLGENYDSFDISFQTTRFTRIWGNLSKNYWKDINPEKIIGLSFQQTRQEFLDIYKDEENVGGKRAAVEALIADQLENPKFRKWWANIEDNQVLHQI